MNESNSINYSACSGLDPDFAAACPLCKQEGNDQKYVGFDLSDHIRTKHSKASLADFLSAEACSSRF